MVFGPISPAFLKKVLELEGYALVIDDPSYWVLARRSTRRSTAATTPIVLPRTEEMVQPDALTHVLRHAGISDEQYVWLFEIVSAAKGYLRH